MSIWLKIITIKPFSFIFTTIFPLEFRKTGDTLLVVFATTSSSVDCFYHIVTQMVPNRFDLHSQDAHPSSILEGN